MFRFWDLEQAYAAYTGKTSVSGVKTASCGRVRNLYARQLWVSLLVTASAWNIPNMSNIPM